MRDIDLLVSEARALEAARVLAAVGFVPEADDAATLHQALADDHQLPAQQHPALASRSNCTTAYRTLPSAGVIACHSSIRRRCWRARFASRAAERWCPARPRRIWPPT